MRRLGDVVRIAAGRIIVRCPDGKRPDLGSETVNVDLVVVGTVVDVFGPVDRPYATVIPDGKLDPGIVGQRLYVR